jgi:hypothetical protein
MLSCPGAAPADFKADCSEAKTELLPIKSGTHLVAPVIWLPITLEVVTCRREQTIN